MNTIGKVIRGARTQKRFSRERLEEKTKIKREFIKAIEEEDWKSLPDYVVVQGFVKSLASVLDINEKHVVALFRRDFPPNNVSANPKPDVSERFVWSPKLTFIIGGIFTFIVVLGYLGYQYVDFISPPKLEISSPLEGERVSGDFVKVEGRVDSDVSLKVNNQLVLVEETGKFSVDLEVSENTEKIEVIAKSRTGNETVLVRNIKVELE